MAKDIPYFRFDIYQWMLGKIKRCPYDSQGLFISICCLYWKNDGDLTIGEITDTLQCRNFTRMLRNLTEKQIICSETSPECSERETKIKIKFLDEQFEAIFEKSERFRNAGLKGLKKRWGKKEDDSQAIATLQTENSQAINGGIAYKEKDKYNDKEKDRISIPPENDREGERPKKNRKPRKEKEIFKPTEEEKDIIENYLQTFKPDKRKEKEKYLIEYYKTARELLDRNYKPWLIKYAVNWARNDPFWIINFKAFSKLLKQNTQNEFYIDVFIDRALPPLPTLRPSLTPTFDPKYYPAYYESFFYESPFYQYRLEGKKMVIDTIPEYEKFIELPTERKLEILEHFQIPLYLLGDDTITQDDLKKQIEENNVK